MGFKLTHENVTKPWQGEIILEKGHSTQNEQIDDLYSRSSAQNIYTLPHLRGVALFYEKILN